MEKVIIGNATLFKGNCMAGLIDAADGQFSLAIVDPPYGLGKKITAGGTWSAKHAKANPQGFEWDVAPTFEYFHRLKRVTTNQIIWGANYFAMPPCRGFIVWDKGVLFGSGQTFAEGEYAWTSFDRNAKITRVMPLMGFLCRGVEERIHPTQKPVSLYRWLLANYAIAGDTILDTHMGSGSSVIACLDAGLAITAYEANQEYFDLACERIERSQQQMKLAL